ncbi:endo-1,4-beta-xylanase [Microseira wollei]|uniref:Beta-xylanase n=1 Tax=Microseira wollei NIES-4236 TaxID=2530354 RepID=A0AAV3X0Q5_9CYAN|nr:endo-1,4-beta-xylanase [Microseira wollei]GET35554.1 endo-1-beta-xylanase [Microseira wollei NIES-4236]
MFSLTQRRRFKTFLFLAATTVLIVVLLSIPQSSHTAVTSLRSLAQNRGIVIGAAVAINALRNEPVYREVLAREFSSLTAENAMKFRFLHPKRERYDFTDADTLVTFAEDNNMKVRGHTLVWHIELPQWLTEGKFTRQQLLQILRDHIYTVVGHYRGQVFAWDVVNEGIGDNNGLRDTIWLREIGPEYIDLAFRWAQEADPKARLFYNDYGGEGLGAKSDAIYNLVRGMVQRGVPIHGVGLQMHVGLNNAPPPADVAANIQRFAALGLDVHITEMDVQIQNATGTQAERFAAQAKIYRDLLGVCLSKRNCQAFVLWGFTDKHSWIPWFTKKPDAALIFDNFYRPKPAYNALKEVLRQRR